MRRAPDSNRIRLVRPDVADINYPERPLPFTLLPATLPLNFWAADTNTKLVLIFFSSFTLTCERN